jgi:phosphatidylglycerophosphatase A
MRKKKTLDYVAFGIASCGIGYMPIVSATWGSLFAAGIYFLAVTANEAVINWADEKQISTVLLDSGRASFIVIFLIILFLIGIWASTRVEEITGEKDSSIIIIDEVVGQFITFLFVPVKMSWWIIFIGFIVFRIFDIWKPFPANKLESLPKGLGVMADDVMAGFYSAAFLSLIVLGYVLIS